MKPCGTCKETTQDGQVFGVLPQKLDSVVMKYLPKQVKIHHNNRGQKFKIHHGIPNQFFFYFGSKPRDPGQKLLKKDDAYGDLSNSGIARFDSNGSATVFLDCPQVYIYDDGKVYHRHFHFVYWHKTRWGDELFTSPVLCIVGKDFIKHWNQDLKVINALPQQEFEKRHIPNSYNLPYNELWTESSVKKILGIKNKQYPLVVHCLNKKCKAGEMVCNRLAMLGFYNLFLYELGIEDWS